MRTVLLSLGTLLTVFAVGLVQAGVQDDSTIVPNPTDAVGETGAPRTGEFDLRAGVGIKHDSNVAVLELDTTSGEDDVAGLFDLGVGYKYPLTDKATVRAEYALSHTGYRDFTDFNLTIHRATIDAGYDFDALDGGITFHYIDARLDGDGFMTMRQVSPYLAKLFSTRLYLRGAYIRTDKKFDGNPLRDATSDAVSADAFLFLNGVRTFLNFGYRFSREDAEAGQFDYDGHQLSAQLTHKFPAVGRDLTFKGRVRYEGRRYDEITPSIGEQRDEDRYRADISLMVPFGERFNATAAWEYSDNRSNLPSVDFAERVWSLRLDARI